MDEWNKPIQHSDSILMLEFHAFEGVRHLLLHQYFKMQKRGNKFFLFLQVAIDVVHLTNNFSICISR